MKLNFWFGAQFAWWVALSVVVFSLGDRISDQASAWETYSILGGLSSIGVLCALGVYTLSAKVMRIKPSNRQALLAGVVCCAASLVLAFVLRNQFISVPVLRLLVVFFVPPLFAPLFAFRRASPA